MISYYQFRTGWVVVGGNPLYAPPPPPHTAHCWSHGYAMLCVIWLPCNFRAVYKSGTGTRGRGHRDACVRTWDLGTQDKRLEDIKYGTRGRVGRGRRDVKYRDAGDAGCEWLLQKSEVNAICLSSWKCVIYDSFFQNHIGHLMMFTQNISL